MCGICGFTGKSDLTSLKNMMNAIEHRGPDEEGYYTTDRINLGIRRLSIVDVTTGQQPIHNEDESIRVVFNGEIYNAQALRDELVKKGHRFYTDHADTEVLVHLYEEYGPDFVQQLNGMFAIAIYDQNARKLYLIRDRMGVKPLFYAFYQGQCLFASEIKAILAYLSFTPEMNYEAIYHYFTFKNIPTPLTAFNNIESLLPGEMLIVPLDKPEDRHEKRKWWTIHFAEQPDWGEAYIKDTILGLLEDATRIRLYCDVPFGAYLSGGLDSSSVVALMSRFVDRPLKTFSLGYQDELAHKEADLFYARRIAKQFKTEHYEYIMPFKELEESIDDVARAFDQPFSGTISTYFLTRLIRRHVKVALSGDGADELFGSYLSHRTALPMYHYRQLKEKVRAGTLTAAESELLAPCTPEYLNDLATRAGEHEADWRYALYFFGDEEKKELLTPAFLEQLPAASGTRALLTGYFAKLKAGDALNRVLEMEWQTQLPDQVLAFVDFLSMAHGVEIRSPFLDYRLVEFVARLPGSWKIKAGNVKDILKRTVRELVPEEITRRPKEGFVLPVYDWLAKEGRTFCQNILSPARLQKHGFFKLQQVQNLLAKYFSGCRDLAGRIWNLMMFQIWWEIYVG